MITSPRAIICIETSGKSYSSVNYSRRMYAIIRRYTPHVVENKKNTCYAELTGLRTFFKKSYKELASQIVQDLEREMTLSFTVRVISVNLYEEAKASNGKNNHSVSTYKELSPMFLRRTSVKYKRDSNLKNKLNIPFLGNVR